MVTVTHMHGCASVASGEGRKDVGVDNARRGSILIAVQVKAALEGR